MTSYLQATFDSPLVAAGDGCNASTNATFTTSSGAPPQDLSSLLAALIPFAMFAKLPDWMKLAIIGSIIETCRRFTSWLWTYTVSAFNVTARFESNDTSYGQEQPYMVMSDIDLISSQNGFSFGCPSSRPFEKLEMSRSVRARGARALMA
jgi:hypothetical protein